VRDAERSEMPAPISSELLGRDVVSIRRESPPLRTLERLPGVATTATDDDNELSRDTRDVKPPAMAEQPDSDGDARGRDI
jgi:hypothetical protein